MIQKHLICWYQYFRKKPSLLIKCLPNYLILLESIRLAALLILAISFFMPLWAKDFGVQGETFPILENDLLKLIESRLQKLKDAGQIAPINDELAKRVKDSIERPTAVVGLRRTQHARQWTYDPTVIVQEDIKDHNGQVIAKKGTRINPLDYGSWGTPLLLIDGDDVEQVEWSHPCEDILVLVQGAPLELERQLKRPVYFDQGGKIIQRFGVRQVPCRISQAGKVLLVEELELPRQQRESQNNVIQGKR